MGNNQYLRFFNKKGEYCNFEYLEDLDKWIGRIDIQTVSEGLFESEQIYILEEIYDSNQNQKVFAFPHIISSSQDDAHFDVKFEPEDNSTTQIFLFEVNDTELITLNNQVIDSDWHADDTFESEDFEYPRIKSSSLINNKALQINVGFGPTGEDGYKSTLIISYHDEATASEKIAAEIIFYGEGESEDERLSSLLMSLGNDILPTDSIIFDESDVKEIKPDWSLINRKRKELLLEYSNIFPYMGSYKALINILKFYGYQNVRMKEYWKNVDQSSPNFGKYRQTDITDIFSQKPDPQISKLLPSKIYKKTNLFGLFYDINVATDQFDEFGTPITEEVFSFTPEEILIKLYALKRKLVQYYLPLNAKIVDIIGEAIFFATYRINSVVSQNRIDSVSLGLKPAYEILPNSSGYLQDLRPIINTDVQLPQDIGPSTINPLWTSSYGRYEFLVQGGFSLDANTPSLDVVLDFDSTARLQYTFNYIYKEYEVGTLIGPFEFAKQLASAINDPNGTYVREGTDGDFNSTLVFDGYSASIRTTGTAQFDPCLLIILEKRPNPSVGDLQFLDEGDISLTSILTNLGASKSFLGGVNLNEFENSFIKDFNNFNLNLNSLNDSPNIPIGYPVLLKNKSFDISWDKSNVTFNQIDSIGSTFSTLYSNFLNSFTVIGWTSNGGPSTPEIESTVGFPTDYPHEYTYSWDNLGFYGHSEMQWIVRKNADETPEFIYDSGQKPIQEIKDVMISLPYVGKYDVELRLWDLYNTQSYIIDNGVIEVKMAESDFIGWYTKRELDYRIDDRPNKVQSDYATSQDDFIKSSDLMTWDRYTSTWDLPLHPNESVEMAEITNNSLDSVEFYQTIVNPVENPLIDRYAYSFNLIGESATWDDSYHLWWDNTGTKLTQWTIDTFNAPSGASGAPTAAIFIARGNNAHILSDYEIYYATGPTGWTGPTNPGAGFTSGDLMYVRSNRKVFIHNGNEFELTDYEMDSIIIQSLPGGTSAIAIKNRALITFDALNKINSTDNPIFSDFIYYYNEKYDSSYKLIPQINAVSKNLDKGERHQIRYTDEFNGDFKSYETAYFGYLGDIPTYFEIVGITGPSNSFTVTYLSGNVKGTTSITYNIGSTSSSNLSLLCDELNGPTAQSLPIIGDFEYNMVFGSSGWTGLGGGSNSNVKIQAVAKTFVESQSIGITGSTGIRITSYGRSVCKNPSWDNLRIAKYSEEFPILTTLNYTYDNSKIVGKTDFLWRLQKEEDPTFVDIYYNNPYFSYMFNQKGSYSLSLTITDSNGNSNTIKKPEIIKII